MSACLSLHFNPGDGKTCFGHIATATCWDKCVSPSPLLPKYDSIFARPEFLHLSSDRKRLDSVPKKLPPPVFLGKEWGRLRGSCSYVWPGSNGRTKLPYWMKMFDRVHSRFTPQGECSYLEIRVELGEATWREELKFFIGCAAYFLWSVEPSQIP